jgi:hypothetical protein
MREDYRIWMDGVYIPDLDSERLHTRSHIFKVQRLSAISTFHGGRFNSFYNFYLAMLLISFCKAPPLRLTKTFSLYG